MFTVPVTFTYESSRGWVSEVRAPPGRAGGPLRWLRGEHDGIATESDVLAYFSKLATKDKELRIIPDATHALIWGNQRAVAWEALRSFLVAGNSSASS